MKQSESELQTKIADYLRLQYPDVLFHSDFGSGIKLTMGQAAKQKRQNGGRRAWPDMFIAEAKFVKLGTMPFQRWNDNDADSIGYANGLFLEFKKEGTRLQKKDGNWASEHIAEQAEVLAKLRGKGYVAEFAVGFENAKVYLDYYLQGVIKR